MDGGTFKTLVFPGIFGIQFQHAVDPQPLILSSFLRNWCRSFAESHHGPGLLIMSSLALNLTFRSTQNLVSVGHNRHRFLGKMYNGTLGGCNLLQPMTWTRWTQPQRMRRYGNDMRIVSNTTSTPLISCFQPTAKDEGNAPNQINDRLHFPC